MSKGMGSWLGGCAGIQESETLCPASALNSCVTSGQVVSLVGPHPLPILSIYLDHKFPVAGSAPSYMFAQCLAQRGLRSGDLRYHSHINNYSGGKSPPGALLYTKPLLF